MKKGCKGYLQRTLKYTSVHAPDCIVYNGLKGRAIGQLKDFPSPKKIAPWQDMHIDLTILCIHNHMRYAFSEKKLQRCLTKRQIIEVRHDNLDYTLPQLANFRSWTKNYTDHLWCQFYDFDNTHDFDSVLWS